MQATTTAPARRSLLIIDGAYLQHSNKGIDYVKLVAELEREIGDEFYEKWFLTSEINSNQSNKNQFHSYLRSAPPNGPQFRVKIFGVKPHTGYCKRCRGPSESTVQKGVDVGIATLLLKHAYQNLYDKLVLIAGDSDFLDAISTVHDDLRKQVIVVGFQDSSVSTDLQQVAQVIWMDSLMARVEHHPVTQIIPQYQPPLPKSAPFVFGTATKPQEAAQNVQNASENWECKQCTYENNGTVKICEMCETPRSPQPSNPFILPQPKQAQQSGSPQLPPQVQPPQPHPQQQPQFSLQQQQQLPQQQQPQLPHQQQQQPPQQQQPQFPQQPQYPFSQQQQLQLQFPQQRKPHQYPFFASPPLQPFQQAPKPPVQVVQPQQHQQEVPCPICTFYRLSANHKCDMCGYLP